MSKIVEIALGFGEYQKHTHASMAALRGQVVTT